MDDKRSAGEVGPHDYLQGYRDGVKRIVEHLLGKEDIARRGLARLRTPSATGISTRSDQEEEEELWRSLAPPSELLVVVGNEYIPRIGELITRMTAMGLEVEKGNVDYTAGTILAVAPRRRLPLMISNVKKIEGVKDVEEMRCVSIVVDDKHLSSASLDDVVTRAKAAGLRLKSTNAAIGIIIGSVRPGALEPLGQVAGIRRVEEIKC